jgi:hypothetical protein
MRLFADAWPVEPLAASWSAQRASTALVDTFIGPWAHAGIGATVIGLAAIGAWRMRRDRSRGLGLLLWLFGPYAVYHLLLQWTETVRYAIPLVPLVAAPAAVAISAMARGRAARVGLAAAALVAAGAWITVPALREYGDRKSPPARAIDYLQQLSAIKGPLVVAGHHVFRRHLERAPAGLRMIDTDVREEWRALTRYWVAGGQESIWFLRDPSRATLRRIDPTTQHRIAGWEWPASVRRLLRGERPVRVELVRIDQPRWFAENGFRIGGDAGPAEVATRGPHLLFARADLEQVLISGRAAAPGSVATLVARHPQQTRNVRGVFSVGALLPAVRGGDPYLPVELTSDVPLDLTDVAIAPAAAKPVQLERGFYAAEQDDDGRRFRWMGPEGRITVVRSGARARLELEGRVPKALLGNTLRLVVDGEPAGMHAFDRPDFALTVDLPDAARGATTTVDLAVSASFVPDRVDDNGDDRVLALALFRIAVMRLGAPGDGEAR